MQYALNEQDVSVEPSKDATGRCPLCKTDVLAKCGKIIPSYWAHKSVQDCDPWWEPEGVWHRTLKGFYPREYQEVTIGRHRADVHRNGCTLELQHSSISPEMIQERERFYKKIIWFVDANAFWGKNVLAAPNGSEDGTRNYTLQWKRRRKCWDFSRADILFDTPYGLFASPYHSDGRRHMGVHEGFWCADGDLFSILGWSGLCPPDLQDHYSDVYYSNLYLHQTWRT